MASIYRPSYTDPKTGKRRKGKTYRIAYVDEQGVRRSVGGYTDKTATEAKAKEIEARIARIKAGLPVLQTEKSTGPLEAALEAYSADLERLGRTTNYIKQGRFEIMAMARAKKWTSLSRIRPDDVRSFLSELHRAGRSVRTVNHYRESIVYFLNWCVRNQWIETNVANHVQKAKGDAKHPRRAFTMDEFRRLVNVSPDRHLVYFLAGTSGLRRNELRFLEKRDCNPIQQTWHLRAGITKAKRLDVIPMLAEAASALMPRWETLPGPTSRIFPTWPRHQTFEKDLKRARIPKVNEEGRRVDFHSLRYFFCTMLGKTLPIQVVRKLMRHKDIRTTCNLYMDLGISDVTEGVNQLPPIFTEKETAKEASNERTWRFLHFP